MLRLSHSIDRIKALIEDDTDASISYAALEARLALEKVCYDRLRQVHEYISHAQLRRWQPSAVMKILITDVDQNVAETLTLMISKNPAVPGVQPTDEEFVEIGTQIGFDAKKVGELWNALSGLALHANVPKAKDVNIPDYGDRAKIRSKVEEALFELERLAKGTMTFSGLGETVSFDCTVCNSKNKRRASLLREGQRIFCIAPDCLASFTVRIEGSTISFEGETCDFPCQSCGQIGVFPWRFFNEKLKFGEKVRFNCRDCDHENYIEWRLCQVAPLIIEKQDMGC